MTSLQGLLPAELAKELLLTSQTPYGSEYVRAASLRHTTKDTRRRVTSVADKTEGTSSRTQSYPVDPREGTSRATLSEPTYTESHLDIRLDYLHELRERINDATNQMFGQMGAEAEQLATDMLQLKMRIRERTRSTNDFIQDHAYFIHNLRVKMEKERLEERMERDRLRREKKGDKENGGKRN
ncbi:hypothetical protein HPB51_011496 [Rhipicephalus microplus]|uniref:Uncharacterized protein n=1 Tax=Rhipicephalus microplus TaxID=6941 RepID=A0A9J6E9F0_RHIMP|nr:hypothetical protein HPB51_011496 [Rhipicephalus microplus]